MEGHPNADLQAGWKYYLEEAEQEEDVKKQLEELRKERKNIKPEEITVMEMQIPVLIKELSAPQILKIA